MQWDFAGGSHSESPFYTDIMPTVVLRRTGLHGGHGVSVEKKVEKSVWGMPGALEKKYLRHGANPS